MLGTIPNVIFNSIIRKQTLFFFSNKVNTREEEARNAHIHIFIYNDTYINMLPSQRKENKAVTFH